MLIIMLMYAIALEFISNCSLAQLNNCWIQIYIYFSVYIYILKVCLCVLY